jgi:hypothetical protein
LRQHGGDYEQISKRMGRDRKQIKNKVKAEEKRNPERIKHAFANRLRLGQFRSNSKYQTYLTRRTDRESLKRDLGIDLDAGRPFDLEDVRQPSPGSEAAVETTV